MTYLPLARALSITRRFKIFTQSGGRGSLRRRSALAVAWKNPRCSNFWLTLRPFNPWRCTLDSVDSGTARVKLGTSQTASTDGNEFAGKDYAQASRG